MFSGACPRHITKAMLRAMLTVPFAGKSAQPVGFFAGCAGHPQSNMHAGFLLANHLY